MIRPMIPTTTIDIVVESAAQRLVGFMTALAEDQLDDYETALARHEGILTLIQDVDLLPQVENRVREITGEIVMLSHTEIHELAD